MDKTPTDTAIAHAVARAKALGLKVMLKPHVDCDTGWRGQITPDSAGEWFRSYRAFICHYAALAESLGCEQFCVGTELEGTTREHEAEWRAIIDSVESRFHDTLTYAANWDRYRTDVPFWDALDLVGIDAYFPLTNTNNPTVAELVAAWNARWLPTLDSFQARVGKPLLITEIGYRSVDSTNVRPWDYNMTGPVDTAEQRDCYEAAFEALWGRPWFRGFYWWNWTASPSQGGPNDDDYTPHDKPAERVLTQWYRATAVAQQRPQSLLSQPILIPNPVRPGATVTLRHIPAGARSIAVYDLTGSLRWKCTLTGEESKVKLTGLSLGRYMLVVAGSGIACSPLGFTVTD